MSLVSFSEVVFLLALTVFFFLVKALMKNWFHIIMLLMIMEMMMLFIFLIFALKSLSLDPLMALFIFATYMVIEASLAVSILTLIVRSHGNDFIMI